MNNIAPSPPPLVILYSVAWITQQQQIITFIPLWLRINKSVWWWRSAHTFFVLPQKGEKKNPEHQLCKRGSVGSAEQKTTCELVVRLLDEGGGSGVEGSASHLHHHRLEASTASLLRTSRTSRVWIHQEGVWSTWQNQGGDGTKISSDAVDSNVLVGWFFFFLFHVRFSLRRCKIGHLWR